MKVNKAGNRRGTNPNSHGNHQKGGKAKRSVSLLPITINKAASLGSNLSEGIDNAFALLEQAEVIIKEAIAYLPKDQQAITTELLTQLDQKQQEQHHGKHK